MTLKDLMNVMDSIYDVTIYDASGLNPLYEYDGDLPEWLEDIEITQVYVDEGVNIYVKAFMLDDYYKWQWWDDQNIVVEGKVYPTEMTLDPKVPDTACRRVWINGSYCYFS